MRPSGITMQQSGRMVGCHGGWRARDTAMHGQKGPPHMCLQVATRRLRDP